MNDLDNLYVRRPRAIRITPFTPDKADYIMPGGKPIYFIHTREGRRHINEDMLIAEKSDTYRHPMDPKVFEREYVNILAYDSAFAAELKAQIAEQLRRALNSDDLQGEVELLANMLSEKPNQASIHEEHEER